MESIQEGKATANLHWRQDAELDVPLVRLSMVILDKFRKLSNIVAGEMALCLQMKNKQVKMQKKKRQTACFQGNNQKRGQGVEAFGECGCLKKEMRNEVLK